MTDESQEPSLIAAAELERSLTAVWLRHLPETSQRLERVARALEASSSRTLDEPGRHAAIEDAHLLIGVAATYGRAELVGRARLAHDLLVRDGQPADPDPDPDPDPGAGTELAARLRSTSLD